EKLRDGTTRVDAHPARQGDAVAALDCRDRIELDGPETRDRRLHLGWARPPGAGGVSLRGDRAPAKLGQGDRLAQTPFRRWARYSSRSERVNMPAGRPARATTTAGLPAVRSANTRS